LSGQAQDRPWQLRDRITTLKESPDSTGTPKMATKAKLTARAPQEREAEIENAPTQQKRPEIGRYLLQIDRQTKRSFETEEAATKAAQIIKNGHPIVQVAIYDTVAGVSSILQVS
jgi:hypothetical protein